MRRPVAVAVAVTVAAATAALAAENPQPDLTVSRNGETIAIRTALATDKGDGAVKLFFSSATPTCEEILAPMRSLGPGEVSFELTRTTWGDGSTQWTAYYSDTTEPPADGAEIEVEIDPAKGGKSTGRIEVLFRSFKEGDVLRVEGTFEAIGCGGE